jgi:hypothetical protein
MRTLLACLFGFGTVFFGVACGGKVEVTSTGGAGGAGSTTGTTTNSTTSTTMTSSVATTGTSTATGAGGGDIQTDCAVLCKVTSQQKCSDPGTCVQDCVAAYQQVPSCQPQYLAYFDCVAAHADEIAQCSAPAACDPELQAFTQCTGQQGSTGGGGCSPESCEASPNTCGCEVVCNGQTYQTKCKAKANGTTTCQCTINGSSTTCTEPTLECGVFESCCGAFAGDG